MVSATVDSMITKHIIRDGGSHGINRLELTPVLLGGTAILVGDKGQLFVVPK